MNEEKLNELIEVIDKLRSRIEDLDSTIGGLKEGIPLIKKMV